MNRQDPLPPRRWATWIKSGHSHEAAMRENSDVFFTWMPEIKERRAQSWARRGRELAGEPADVAAMIQAEVSRQLDALKRRPQAEPATAAETKQTQGAKVVIPSKQYRKMKGGK